MGTGTGAGIWLRVAKVQCSASNHPRCGTCQLILYSASLSFSDSVLKTGLSFSFIPPPLFFWGGGGGGGGGVGHGLNRGYLAVLTAEFGPPPPPLPLRPSKKKKKSSHGSAQMNCNLSLRRESCENALLGTSVVIVYVSIVVLLVFSLCFDTHSQDR